MLSFMKRERGPDPHPKTLPNPGPNPNPDPDPGPNCDTNPSLNPRFGEVFSGLPYKRKMQLAETMKTVTLPAGTPQALT